MTEFDRRARSYPSRRLGRHLGRHLGVAVMAAALARPAMAQFRVGADGLLATRYVWRGVERTNGFVLQPDAYLAYSLKGAGWITGGVWGNVESSTGPAPISRIDPIGSPVSVSERGSSVPASWAAWTAPPGGSATSTARI